MRLLVLTHVLAKEPPDKQVCRVIPLIVLLDGRLWEAAGWVLTTAGSHVAAEC